MRHCLPQESVLRFLNTEKANRQNTGYYSEKILAKYSTYSSLLYIGKPTREPSEHYLAVTDDTAKHLVTNWGNYVDI